MNGKVEKWDLTVRGDTVERLFENYRSRRYIVNRSYQRKLVWTLEEKQFFIDSIANRYPVPIILIAEQASKKSGVYEIIDGLQRLNSIFSFIENEYQVNDGFFDLTATAFTKLNRAGFAGGRFV